MKIFQKIIFFILIFTFSHGQSPRYYYIGSSENTVLKIQGQPSSISRIGNNATFFYGSSYVSFTNNIVDGYQNNGNLKIRVISTENTSKKRKEGTQPKQVNNEVKWIYFTFISDSPSFSYDNFTNKLEIKNDYSKLFSISGYTLEMQKNLEFCIQKEYKESTGRKATLIPHVYSDRELAMLFWNDEKGYMKSFSCWYLNNYGITQH